MKIINTMYLWSQCSIAKLCLTVCEPMDRSTPGCPVFHYLLEFCSNSCPLSWWCHPTISSLLVVHFSSYLQSFQASGSFLMSQLFTSGGQNFGASASVLLMNIQNWLHLRLTGLISFQESFPTPQFESINSLGLSLLYGPTIRDYVYFVGSPYPGLLIVSQ